MEIIKKEINKRRSSQRPKNQKESKEKHRKIVMLLFRENKNDKGKIKLEGQIRKNVSASDKGNPYT